MHRFKVIWKKKQKLLANYRNLMKIVDLEIRVYQSANEFLKNPGFQQL